MTNRIAICCFFATLMTSGCRPPLTPPDASDGAPNSTIDAASGVDVYDKNSDAAAIDSMPFVSPCVYACASMAVAGCREGRLETCAATICQINSDPHFAHYDLGCLSNAKTPTDVKACGVACTP